MAAAGVLLVVTALMAMASADMPISTYDVVWNDLQAESTTFYTNTMPIGNGFLTANVLGGDAQKGAITILISQAGAWSEAGELIKIGFVNISFSPSPFAAGSFFEMRMDLTHAAVVVLLGGTQAAPALQVEVFTHASSDFILVNATSLQGTPYAVAVKSTLVRPVATTVTPAFDCAKYPVSADTFADGSFELPNAVAFYHRNSNTSFFHNTLHGENLGPATSSIPDRFQNRTMGAVVTGQGLRKTGTDTLVSAAPATQQLISIFVLTAQTATAADWLSAAAAGARKGPASRAEHDQWWAAFWARSSIQIINDFVVSRQFALERFLQATQARSPYPIKFNGMLFTAIRPPNADTRDWGGLNWWQNLRLPYYNMLAAGDDDMLATLFEAFLLTLPLAQARTQIYFNYTGAFWPEYTHPLMGTTHPASYGCGREGKTNPPIGYSSDPWNHYNWQNGLDLSLLILDHYAHTQDDAVLKRYLPITLSVLEFYSHRFSQIGPDGKIIIFPSQSLETWQCPNYPPQDHDCVTDDAPTISGLLAVLPRVLALPSSFVDPTQHEYLAQFLSRVPALPLAKAGSDTVIAPCAKASLHSPSVLIIVQCPPGTSNVENTELYPVHPYRLFGVGKDNLSLAVTTFAHKRFTSDIGWNQNAMDAALLGLASDAKNYVSARAATAPAPGLRFPAFMPHLQDYEPSSDHLGVFSNALTYMLIQSKDDPADTILLLPAWPCAWDATFRVHGPRQTVIEGSILGGHLSFTVTPSSRQPDVVALPCQQTTATSAIVDAPTSASSCKLGQCE